MNTTNNYFVAKTTEKTCVAAGPSGSGYEPGLANVSDNSRRRYYGNLELLSEKVDEPVAGACFDARETQSVCSKFLLM